MEIERDALSQVVGGNRLVGMWRGLSPTWRRTLLIGAAVKVAESAVVAGGVVWYRHRKHS